MLLQVTGDLKVQQWVLTGCSPHSLLIGLILLA